ncbi:MAG TPA: arabinofuranosidase catalytic domain-containing protein [Polyangiaceae bacterium]|nr:arabinofuranosidase catalytic domain-containing protein [Polyangiaceae bacterium]
MNPCTLRLGDPFPSSRSRRVSALATLALAVGCGGSSPSNGGGTGGASDGGRPAGGAGGSGAPESAGAAGSSGAKGGSAGSGGNSLGGSGVGGTHQGGAGAAGIAGEGHGGSSGGSASGHGGASGRASSGGTSGGGTAASGRGAGGAAGAAGSGVSGGGSGGSGTTNASPPGDIAAQAGTPFVAAHSVTRALFAAYSGKLFLARRASDGKTEDIGTAGTGGFVDLNALTTFCSGTTCTVARLYDQTGNGNDLWQDTATSQPSVGSWSAADGNAYPIVVSKGYQWLRNRNQTKKIPTGASPQTEYFVVHGDYAGRASGTNGCCYDYGNMENHIGDDGPGTMSALYFGDATDWTRGAGNGPWVMLDMENGVFAGGGSIAILNAGQASVNSSDPSLKYASPNIVVGLAKTDGTKNFELKYGNASSGALTVAWNGSLPTNSNPTSYIPLHQQGGISLGEGGDGSAMGTGAFSEGAVMASETTDATDDAIQTNLTSVYR